MDIQVDQVLKHGAKNRARYHIHFMSNSDLRKFANTRNGMSTDEIHEQLSNEIYVESVYEFTKMSEVELKKWARKLNISNYDPQSIIINLAMML